MIVVFFLLWVILNGRVTLEIILTGIVIAAAVFALSRAVFNYSLKDELLFWRNIPLMILYVINLIGEILKASLAVIRVIRAPAKHPDPVLIEFDSEFSSVVQNVVLANSITLTPGTYTVRLEGNHFLVHCLIPEFAEGIEDSSFVKLLRKMHLSG